MNKNLNITIKRYLNKYEEKIEELDIKYDMLKTLGRYDPCSPYIDKHELSFLIEGYEKEGFLSYEIINEYNRINEKLHLFEKKRGKVYRDLVFEGLKYRIDTYYTVICYFLKSDPIDLETENDLAGRDIIEILLKELEMDYNVDNLKIKVMALDDALKCIFKNHIEEILNECPLIEREEFPENFWWRHPSEFKNY